MRRVGRWFAALVPAVTAVAGSVVVAAPANAAPCPDVEVIFARGTFEPAGVGGVGQAFVDALRAKTPGKSVEVYPVNYPASLDFATAADGVIDASNRVRATAANCPDTEIVLGGYSQGAAVAAYITEDAVPEGYTPPPGMTGPMEPEVADRVAAVTLFGKPSSGFLQMIYTGAPPINVGSRYVSKTLDLCVVDDPVCSPGGGNNGAHGAYVVNGMVNEAADYAVGKLPGGESEPVETVAQG
ncbi:cutinase family protein [Mycolicibacterium arseniciresistens]|uniref:Cutinase n=1 Tax=Mycolicibacterium arseniciresistens TaxID=3062257 RepID=A0ABT8UJ89_9MYCO|nr:cutinase family protein [Mycolicibacterium arseniciresistens]MDO3637869.1 cutinase family protein [Mycolicibacterium arseniciresistens]